MYSSGTSATATTSASAATLITIPPGAAYNVLKITNEGGPAGFFSIDGGSTWARVPGSGSTAGSVNQVNSIPFVDSSGSGTFMLTVEGTPTGAITYSATPATLVASINTALNSALGTGAVVASGATLAAMILTASGPGYSGRPIGPITATILSGSTGYTINGSGTVGTPSTCVATTAGAASTAPGSVAWNGRSNKSVLIKRDGSTNMAGVFGYADWIDYP